jgi:hypothetical protein
MNNFEQTQSHMIYLYTPRSHSTREMYLRRLRRFFDAINIEGSTFGARCNLFAKGREDPSWAFNCILRFVQSQKDRVDRKEITGGTFRNCVKVIKT